jgi:hypothetical protein
MTEPIPLFRRPLYDDWVVRVYLLLGIAATGFFMYLAYQDAQAAQKYGEEPNSPTQILTGLVLSWTVWSLPVLWVPAFARRAIRTRRTKHAVTE